VSLFQACGRRLGSVGTIAFVAVLARVGVAQPLPAAAPASGAPPAGSESWPEQLDRYLDAIETEQSRNGPHSRALIEQLVALGFAYQERSQHTLAVEALSLALQTTRVNDGLYSLEQLPLLQQLTTSESARGNEPGVAELEDRMLALARQHPDDPRSAAVFRDAADRQMATYERYRKYGAPPEFSVGVSAVGGIPGLGPGGGNARTRMLHRAQRNYSAAIQSILRGDGPANPELPALERALIRSYYRETSDDRAPPQRRRRPLHSTYQLGRESYRRLIVYRTVGAGSDANAALEFARGLIELADWDLLNSHNALALAGYEQAHELLTTEGVSDKAIAALFTPETPVLLPAFMPSPLVSAEPDAGTGRVDVAFELGRYGTTHRIEILDVSGTTAEAASKYAFRFIAGNRFRPRIVGGESGRSTPYYLSYVIDE
jgi:hypothetical protein